MGLANHFFCLCLQHGPATPFDFLTMVSQVCEKVVYLLLLSRGTGAQAPVGGHRVAHPTPDGLVSVEVWAVLGRFTRRRSKPDVVR